jgi:hypothetical protein
MPRHEDLDFPHAPVHCADCWDDQQRGKVLAEMSRANELKEKELNSYDLTDPEYRPQRTYKPYTPPPLPVPKLQKGGINIEPRST